MTPLEHYHSNKEIYQNRTKHWKLIHKDKDLEHKKKYREKTYDCICGSTTSLNHKTRHELTKKHQKYVISTMLELLNSLDI